MKIRAEELVASIEKLTRSDLDSWIERTLIAPEDAAGETVFGEMECARVQLICALRYDMEIADESLSVVLDLVDQLHETRRRLHLLTQAVLAQDEAVSATILARLGKTK